ncbi:hypothetical protein BROUX41_004887 [Berkeleyomyces rouxiae]|uniref:uncharacterized protein n=1 Tax=Berkeleyomyces rouxiae TaxID=2035830 RepID=UPI003B7C3EDF
MSARATRSRIASPAQPQTQGTPSSVRPAETMSKSAAAADGTRSFLQRWLEPEIQNKASFEEHGLMRCGVLENMSALGTLPKLPPKKRTQQNSKSATPIATGPRNPAAAATRAGATGSAKDKQSEKQPVRKIILHPPASASKSKRTMEIEFTVDGDVDSEAEIAAGVSMTSRPGGRKGALKDFAPREDESDDDYRPTAKKSRPSGTASSASTPGGSKRTAASASGASLGHQPAPVSTGTKPGLEKDASATPSVTDFTVATTTPTGRQKRAAASVATAAVAKSASLEAAAETVKALVHKAESQGRHSTARALQAAYNENSGDAEFLSIIDKIYRQRARQSDSSMWSQYDRLIADRRREKRESSSALGGNYNISDSEEDYGAEAMAAAAVGGHFALESASISGLGGGAHAKTLRKGRAGAARDGGRSGSGSAAPDHGLLGLDQEQSQSGWGPESTATNARTGGRISSPGSRGTVASTASSKRKKPTAPRANSQKSAMAHASDRLASNGDDSDDGSRRLAHSQATPFTRVIKLKSRVPPSTTTQSSPAAASVKKEIPDSADEADDGLAPSSPCPASRPVAASRPPASRSASVSTAAPAPTSAAASTGILSRPRSMSLSSDSSLSSLSSVNEDLLLSGDEIDVPSPPHARPGRGPGKKSRHQPMAAQNAKLTNHRANNRANKGSKASKGRATSNIKLSTGFGAGAASPNSHVPGHSGGSCASSQPTTISDFFRRTAQLHQEYKAKVGGSSQIPSASHLSPATTSPSDQNCTATIDEAEQAKFESVADLRRACSESTAALTPTTDSAVREATSQASTASGFRLRPLPRPGQSPTPPADPPAEPADDSMAKKPKAGAALASASSTSSSSLSASSSLVAAGTRATRSSLKRPHDGDDIALDASPPRAATHTPSRAVTPSLPPSKKQRTGPRVKLSPKKGGATSAGVSRPFSRSGAEGAPAQDNDDFCSACGASGELLCCDNCVKAFHFGCIDVESNKLPDQWFCWECRVTRVPSTLQLSPVRGCFAALEVVLERSNPSAFRLPRHIENFFEGVKAAADGTYEDVAPATKKRDRKTEELIDWYKLRDGDSPVLCKACHKSADNIRPIIPCSKCGLHWHLDCLDEPLTVPPVLKTWNCPLHVDPDALAMLISGPAHRYRRIRDSSVVTPMFSRGNRNNGVVEIEDDLDSLRNEYKHNLEFSQNAGWADPQSFGRTYRLKASAVVKDFIESVSISKRPGTLSEKQLKAMSLERKKADQAKLLFQSFSVSDAEAALVIAKMAHTSPAAPTPKLSNVVAIPASPAPTNASKTESEHPHNHNPPSLGPSTAASTTKDDILALITGQPTPLLPAAAGPLSEAAKKRLRAAMLHIQLALGDDAPTPPLDPSKSLPSSPIPPHHVHVAQLDSAQPHAADDAVMTDLPPSEPGAQPDVDVDVDADRDTAEPATASPEVLAQLRMPKDVHAAAASRSSGVVIVDDEAMSDDVPTMPEI